MYSASACLKARDMCLYIHLHLRPRLQRSRFEHGERDERGDEVTAWALQHIPAGMTGVHIAAKFGNIRVMDVLLANSMSIDMPDEMVPLVSPTKLN